MNLANKHTYIHVHKDCLGGIIWLKLFYQVGQRCKLHVEVNFKLYSFAGFGLVSMPC